MKYQEITTQIQAAIDANDVEAIIDLITMPNAVTVRQARREQAQIRKTALNLKQVSPVLKDTPLEQIEEALNTKYTKAEIKDKIKELKRKK